MPLLHTAQQYGDADLCHCLNDGISQFLGTTLEPSNGITLPASQFIVLRDANFSTIFRKRRKTFFLKDAAKAAVLQDRRSEKIS